MKINIKNTFLIFFLVFSVHLVYSIFHNQFFFEEYESLFNGLLSGSLTPGMCYDNLYYFGQIGLSTIYANLYPASQTIPWIPLSQLLFLLFALFFFARQICPDSSLHEKGLWFLLLLLPCLESFHFLNITRISFTLLSIGYLTLLQLQPSKTSKVIAHLLILIGILIRPEPGGVVLLLVTSAYLLTNPNTIRLKLLTLTKTLWPSLLLLSSLGLYFTYDFQHSSDFYKQIEPDVEYELMVNNHFVSPPDSSQNPIAYWRYQAIYKGFWGDSKTNNATYLRSLISSENQFQPQYLFNSFYNFSELVKLNLPIILFLHFLFLLLFYYSNTQEKTKLLLFHLFFLTLIYLLIFRIKMVERLFVPALAFSSLFYLTLLKNKVQSYRTFQLWPTLAFFLFTFSHLWNLQHKLQKYHSDRESAQNSYSQIQNYLKSQDLVVWGESAASLLFKSQKPTSVWKLQHPTILFNSLALCSIEPYQSFLRTELNCDPTDYSSIFTKFAENKNTTFIFRSDEVNFLENYLRVVHGMEIKFQLRNTRGFQAPNEKTVYIYSIQPHEERQ
ncbi:MAG: hypothetical protein K1X82_08600 [Bacteroidia bacterium]|nr:hypothetical protein [Bacteroidia bacterium]